ncbi:MAG: M3 family oligoendopeptidase [bacterium]|nr:M3 family oligoendopeptidase [bacterium]
MEKVEQYTRHLNPPKNQYYHHFTQELKAGWVRDRLEEALKRVESAKSLEDWEKAIFYWNEAKSHIETHFELIELAYHCYTKDESLEKEERRLKEEIEPVYDEWNAKIRDKILNSPLREDLQEKLGSQYFIVLRLKQDAFDPKNIELDTQLNKVMADFTKLTGGANFEVEGKTYPVAHYRKFSNDENPQIRKQSFLSYSSWYLKHREGLENIYDKSIELRQKMARNLGHENFIPLGYQKMRRTDYGPQEVARIREQIHEVLVPLAGRIREKQAESLGVSKVAVWNSNFFPQWKLGPMKVPIAEQPQTALKIYQNLSPELGAHFQKMIQWGLMDLEARDGKGPGAFCTDFSDYRVPFIFLNSVGEASDVTTMLHECGHSFQAWESVGIDLMELRWPSLEACEVHSMGMEFLAYPYYEEFFHPEDAVKYKQKHLAESILLMPYIAMIDEFQHLVYGGKAEGPEGRAEAWEVIEKKYMPYLDFSDLPEWRRHRWIRQLHVFRAPFYYIDYAIAQIGAWQIWMQSLEDKDAAMQSYLNLCRLGGTLPLKDFFAAGNLKLPFEKGVLQNLMNEILTVQPFE